MTNIINSIVTAATFVVTVGPLVIAGVKYLGIKTKNRQIIAIADRAAIIVSAIDNLDLDNESKQATAISKLVSVANELSIPLTDEQATDYIEDAVRYMRKSSYEQEKSK